MKQVVANRIGLGKSTWDGQSVAEPVLEQNEGNVVLDEVTDVIDLPGFVYQRKPVSPEALELPPAAVSQLKEYVAWSCVPQQPFPLSSTCIASDDCFDQALVPHCCYAVGWH